MGLYKGWSDHFAILPSDLERIQKINPNQTGGHIKV